jgi:drug/metabolite transporter (DMT)-like permease
VKPTDLGLLVFIAAVWGGSFMLIRVAVLELGPLALVDVRCLISAALLLVWARLRGPLPLRAARWRQYAILGVVSLVAPFLLIAQAQTVLPASVMAMLMGSIPLVTAPLGARVLREPLGLKRILGLAIGFGGVGIVVGWSPMPLGTATLAAVAINWMNQKR